MRFRCTMESLADGRWLVRYLGGDLDAFEVTANSRAAALEKMRGELRYRLELCPCTGESYQHIPIELVESAS